VAVPPERADMSRTNRKLARAARALTDRAGGVTYAKARATALEHAAAAAAARRAERVAARVALGATEDEAAGQVEAIEQIAAENGTCYDDAAEWFDAPGNQVMCETCGWTWSMVCPECPKGCGCDDTGCTGWRHGEFTEYDADDDDADYHQADCPDCGGSYDFRTGYGCACR
jgi:hypothetical protein